MKKLVLLVTLILPLLIIASGLHVHINNSTIIGTKIIEYFIESNHPDAWLITRYSPVLLNEFMSGALFPDVNREVALQKVFPDIWSRGNDLILSKCSADIKKDLHTSGASLLYEVFNDDNFFGVYQSRLEFYRTFFFLLGIECHNLEDLYVDLIWHPGTSDLYGYGAFTNLTLPWEFSSTYNIYHAFDDVESYLDAVAGFSPVMNALYFDKNNEINYANNIKLIDIIHTTVDEELFFDLFMNGNEAHILELAYLMTIGPVAYV